MKRRHCRAPDASRHHMLANLQNKPQVEFRNPWGALAFCVLFLVFIGSLAAIVLRYLVE